MVHVIDLVNDSNSDMWFSDDSDFQESRVLKEFSSSTQTSPVRDQNECESAVDSVTKKQEQKRKDGSRWGPRKPLGTVDKNSTGEDESTVKSSSNGARAGRSPAAHSVLAEDDRHCCKGETDRLRKECDEYREKSRYLRKDRDDYREEIRYLRGKRDRLKDEVCHYKSEARCQTRRADDLQVEAMELKALLRGAEDTIARLTKENDELLIEHNVAKGWQERGKLSKQQTNDDFSSSVMSLSRDLDRLALGPKLSGSSPGHYFLHRFSESAEILGLQATLESPENLAIVKIREMKKRGKIAVSQDGEIYLVASKGVSFAPFEVRRLKKLFGAIEKEGFVEWFRGERGWRMGAGKAGWGKLALKDLNDCQRHYKLIVTKNKLNDLLYSDPEGDNKEEMWLKRTKLIDAVKDVRNFLELLQHYHEVARPTNDKSGILMAGGEGAMAPEQRWSRIADGAGYLMRTARSGPDAPVHWAAHAKRNKYPLTVVTKESLREVTSVLNDIFQDLFFGRQDA
mmetsp:Transcript_59530/g.176552  ORF Transcript_59530/g.176552 Transcript_59530/m.176552 type:complete len:512 (-) Transcript_59530:116-1651(-)